jgi:hypothetical protein
VPRKSELKLLNCSFFFYFPGITSLTVQPADQKIGLSSSFPESLVPPFMNALAVVPEITITYILACLLLFDVNSEKKREAMI